MYWAHGDLLTIIVSNSLFGKRPATRVITFLAPLFYPISPTLYFFLDQFLFANSAPRPSPELIFCLLLLTVMWGYTSTNSEAHTGVR